MDAANTMINVLGTIVRNFILRNIAVDNMAK